MKYTADALFRKIWKSKPDKSPVTWLRAAISAREAGDYELAKTCKLRYLHSLPSIVTTTTLVTSTGQLVQVVERTKNTNQI